MASGLKIKHENTHLKLRLIAAVMFVALCLLAAFYGVRWYNTGETGPLPLPVAAAGPMIDERELTAQQVAGFTADPSHPRYLTIPMLDVSRARVVTVGVEANNALALPANVHDAGWYDKSSLPGSGAGVVLLDGRSAGLTKPGVFARAESLREGDYIAIERGDGVVIEYEVYDVRSMPIAQVNATGMKEMMTSAQPEREGLSLVIASGNWVPKLREYDRRIMVRALAKD